MWERKWRRRQRTGLVDVTLTDRADEVWRHDNLLDEARDLALGRQTVAQLHVHRERFVLQVLDLRLDQKVLDLRQSGRRQKHSIAPAVDSLSDESPHATQLLPLVHDSSALTRRSTEELHPERVVGDSRADDERGERRRGEGQREGEGEGEGEGGPG